MISIYLVKNSNFRIVPDDAGLENQKIKPDIDGFESICS